MRNLKRALSLALASVMLLGMMVVGTSAASYPDVDENDNVEAIEVLNAVKVMIGKQGNFEPDAAVNRHEMATIMAKLVLGVETADNYVGSHPFTDVHPWADKYVAACYENGLVSGTSATTYGGTQPLTAVQAAAMMLRALGYKDLSKGANDWRAPVTAMANQIRLFDGVASNPSEQLTRNQVAQLALNTLKSPMVNLKDNTISWTDGDGQIIMTGGGREYIALSSREAYAQAINRVESQGTSASAIAGYTVELGEHLYNGKLRLDDDTDVFLRPARTWQYDGKKIGTYVKEELLRETYSTEVTGKMLYDLLSKNTISKYDFTIAIDGVDTDEVTTMTGYFTKGNLVSTNTRGVGATGKGVTTEVYVDSVNGEVTIAVINTYLAKAAEKYNEKRDEVKFNVWGLEQKSGPKFLNKETSKNPAKTFPLVVSGEDFDVENVAKNDIVLVRVADNAIQEIIQPEVIDKTVLSSFSKGSWVNNGTKYDYANTARYDDQVLDQYSKPNMKELTYNLYLDEYGYMIGIERNEDPDQYVFLAGIDAGDSNLKASTADANVIHVDGTMKTVKVDMNKSDLPSYRSDDVNNSQLNTWCKYSMSTSGVYTLTEIDYNAGASNLGQFAQDVAVHHDSGKTNKTINEKRTSLVASTKADGTVDSWVYGNDDTKYINVELKGVVVKDNVNGIWPIAGASGIDYRRIIDDVDTVITGIKDVDLEMTNLPVTQKNEKGVSEYINPDAEIYTLYKNGIVIAAVTIGEDNGSAATWAYITSKEPRQEDYSHETESSRTAQPGEWTWYREAIVDGKIVDLIEVGDSLTYIGNEYGEGDMQQGEWWEVKLDADGNVRKSTLLKNVLGDRFQTESKNVEETVNTESGDVVLHMDFVRADYDSKVDTLTFKNGNLYTNSDLTKGFSVSRDVKVVLGQAQLKSGVAELPANHGVKANVDQWKYKDDIFEGYEGLKSVIDRLDANFVGDLSVIFHNGAAVVIVINDIWGEYIDEGEYIGNGNNAKGDASIKWISGIDWTLTVPANADVSTISKIADYMAKAGCTEIVYTRNGWSFTYEGVRNENQDVTVVKKTSGNYELTVEETTNGTVSYAQKDNDVTLTITPAQDYELASLIVGGKNVTANVENGKYAFTMTADTTVTATFTKTIVGDKVKFTLNLGGGENMYELTGDSYSNLEAVKGSTVTLEPAKALMLTGDVTETSTGVWTVNGDCTVEPREGWSWGGPVFPCWTGTKDNGDLDFAWLTTGTASLSLFSRARAAASDELAPVDPDGGKWFTDMMMNVGKYYEIRVGDVVWGGVVQAGSVTLALRSGTAAEAKEAIKNIGSADIFMGDKEPEVETVTVDIEGDSRPYLFTVNYTGEKPESEAILEAINKALTEAGIDEKAAYIAADAIVVADASDKTLGTIGTVGTFKLYINGTEIEGVSLSNVADEAVTATVPAGATEKLIVEGTGNIATNAQSGVYTPATAMGKTTVTIPVDVMKALDKDLKLVNAYALSLTQNEVTAKYTVGDNTGNAEDTKLFPDGTKFVFTGYKKSTDGTGLKLTLGEKTWTAAAEAAAHVWDEITFDAKTMLNEEDKIKPVEEATNDLKVVIGSNEYTVQFASNATDFTVNMTKVMPKEGKYIALTEDGKWDNSAANVWSAEADGNNMKFTPAQGGETNIVDGVLTLKQAVKVTVPVGLQYAFDGNETAVTAATQQETSKDFYVSLGSAIRIAAKDGATEGNPDKTDRLIVEYTVDQAAKVLDTVTGAYPTWTIPTTLTEDQMAGLSVRMYTARGLIKTIEDEIDTFEGNDAKSGDITYKDNVITATGNLHYVGLPFAQEDANATFRHSVANDLRIFLRELHGLGDDAAENPYATITYKGTEYTWGQQTAAQAGQGNTPATGYLNEKGKTLISVVVEESERFYGKYDSTLENDEDKGLHEAPGGADMVVTLKVDGFDIIFKTVIKKDADKPSQAGNNE